MTKRDYELIAEAIQEASMLLAKQKLTRATEFSSVIASCFTDRLYNTNPRFDADRFEAQCCKDL